jgi:predicted nucleic-acid-binding protein
MIGLDTNVLVRYLAQDDAELLATMTDVLDAAAFRVEQRGAVQAALAAGAKANHLAYLAQATAGKAGFADALIAALASHHGCTQTVTFDRGAAKAAGMTLLAKA